MINFKGSSVVVGDERPKGAVTGESVVPDGGRESKETLQDSGEHAGHGAPAVPLKVELGLQGLVHRLGDLAKRPQEVPTWSLTFSP